MIGLAFGLLFVIGNLISLSAAVMQRGIDPRFADDRDIYRS